MKNSLLTGLGWPVVNFDLTIEQGAERYPKFWGSSAQWDNSLPRGIIQSFEIENFQIFLNEIKWILNHRLNLFFIISVIF